MRMSTGADTKANTLGGGAPEVGDLRLLEHRAERGGALARCSCQPRLSRPQSRMCQAAKRMRVNGR